VVTPGNELNKLAPARRKEESMPFMLYEVSPQGSDKEYGFVRTVQIAGSNGPLYRLQRTKNPGEREPVGWHTTGGEIARQFAQQGAACEVLIDLKPYQSQNVSLYRLMNVWGFSYAEWTPVALHLEALFVDRSEADAAQFKNRFVDHDADRDQVGEFLYLQGGVKGGTWNWGMVGRVNGALLWPDAFDYLAGALRSALFARPSIKVPEAPRAPRPNRHPGCPRFLVEP
jgi:hypothetical protein